MIYRREKTFLDVIAGAGLVDAAGKIDAEPVDHVARPAAAVALQFQRLLRGENAAVAPALGMQQKVALLAEQPKAVPDFPGNLQRRVDGYLRRGEAGRRWSHQPRRQQPGG